MKSITKVLWDNFKSACCTVFINPRTVLPVLTWRRLPTLVLNKPQNTETTQDDIGRFLSPVAYHKDPSFIPAWTNVVKPLQISFSLELDSLDISFLGYGKPKPNFLRHPHEMRRWCIVFFWLITQGNCVRWGNPFSSIYLPSIINSRGPATRIPWITAVPSTSKDFSMVQVPDVCMPYYPSCQTSSISQSSVSNHCGCWQHPSSIRYPLSSIRQCFFTIPWFRILLGTKEKRLGASSMISLHAVSNPSRI